jgi:threonine synthase
MPLPESLTCVLCSAAYREGPNQYSCPKCGELGTLRVAYDYDRIKASASRDHLAALPFRDHWRYLPLLPLAADRVEFPLAVGGTPLYSVPGLRKALGLERLWIKDDTVNPSASLKDRASAVVLLKGQELGRREFATASTGNAGASLACLSAALGLPCHIFVPETAPRAKVAQLLIFGADVLSIRGSYSEAFSLCVQASDQFQWYNRNTGYNPYTVEGKKTVALEIAEQLGWEPPDAVIVATGDGCILSGVWKGFVDLHRLGWISRLPRLVAAQAEGSQAIKQAFDGDGTIRPVTENTLADSISVSLPRNGVMAVQDLKASGGSAVSVSDSEILEAMPLLGKTTGLFGEPAAAAAVAALVKLVERGEVASAERVVVVSTGHGLKDVDAALQAVEAPEPLDCSIDAVGERVGRP